METYHTKEGSTLNYINSQEFEVGRPARIADTSITPGLIYESRSTAPRLQKEGGAVSFDIKVEIDYHRPNLVGARAFNLLLLDDDYAPVGNRFIIIQNGYWRIVDPTSPTIDIILSKNQPRPLDAISTGYLLPKAQEEPREAIDTIYSAFISETVEP